MPPGVKFEGDHDQPYHALLTDSYRVVANEYARILRLLAANGFDNEDVRIEWIDDMTQAEVDEINADSIYTWPEMIQIPPPSPSTPARKY